MSEATVRASGGVLVRGVGADREVALIHRQRYDDWSLPKGKADDGESSEETALREVEEETGITPRIVGFLERVEYTLSSGARKEVDFYLMRPVASESFVPNDEVDALTWVPLGEAPARLTYARDRELLELARFESLSTSGRVHLYRHAHAGSRKRWVGDDSARPLSDKGRLQAGRVADRLEPFGIDKILSSPYDRCVQSVEPLADRLARPIESLSGLEEGNPVDPAIAAIHELAGLEVVMCSHGENIPEILRRLERSGTVLQSDNGWFDCKKASIWEVEVVAGRPATATYRPPPALLTS